MCEENNRVCGKGLCVRRTTGCVQRRVYAAGGCEENQRVCKGVYVSRIGP